MKRIYLAARYSRRDELCRYRADLEALGCTVTSRWLDGDRDNELHADARTRVAVENMEDLTSADACISFTEPPQSGGGRGGRHCEFGAAVAKGQRCIVIGPAENVFHHLPLVECYPTWADFLEAR